MNIMGCFTAVALGYVKNGCWTGPKQLNGDGSPSVTSLLAALCNRSIFKPFLPPALKEDKTAQIAECSELDWGDRPDWQPSPALYGVLSHPRSSIFSKGELWR
jgi:hypothetical protein